jgi:hypothetical protein
MSYSSLDINNLQKGIPLANKSHYRDMAAFLLTAPQQYNNQNDLFLDSLKPVISN